MRVDADAGAVLYVGWTKKLDEMAKMPLKVKRRREELKSSRIKGDVRMI